MIIPLLFLSTIVNGIAYIALLTTGPVTRDECAIGSGSPHNPTNYDIFRLYSTKTRIASDGPGTGMRCPVRIELRDFTNSIFGVLMFLIAVVIDTFGAFVAIISIAQFRDGREYIERWKKKVAWLSFSSRDSSK